jgi:hypothetical protein
MSKVASGRAAPDASSNRSLDEPNSEQTVVTAAHILIVGKFGQLPSCRHDACVDCLVVPRKTDRGLAVETMQRWNKLTRGIVPINWGYELLVL